MEISVALVYLSSLVSAGVAFACWQRRDTAGAVPLFLMMTSLALWSSIYALELTVPEMSQRLAAAYGKYIFITVVPLTWFFFALQYRGRNDSRPGILAGVLLAVPVITVAAIFSNHLHQLFFTSAYIENINGWELLVFDYGPWFWVHTAYSYGLIGLGVIILFRDMLQLSRFYRRQGYLLLAAISLPILSNLLVVFRLLPSPHIDLTPIAMTMTGIIFAIAIFYFGFLEIAPIARDAIFKNLRDVIVIVDRNLRFVDFNPVAAELMGRSVEECIGHAAESFFPHFDCLAHRIISEGEFSQQISSVNQEGETVFYDLHVSPLYADKKQQAGFLIVLRDVTLLERTLADLDRAKSVAEEANAMKGMFLANISHEIRTPLNAVLGFASRLSEYLEGEREKDYLTGIIRGADNLMLLINDILDLSKIEAGKMEINPRPVNMPALLADCEQIFFLKAEEKNLQLIFAVDDNLPGVVLVDDLRLRQILVNLIGNALKFTEKGYVKVEAGWQADDLAGELSLAVTDSGIGIPPEARERIFAAFAQQDGETTRKYGGTGLGLAICRRLATMMDGGLELTSEVGRGSTFTLRVPVRLTFGEEAADSCKLATENLAEDAPLVEYQVTDASALSRWRRLTAQEVRDSFSGSGDSIELVRALLGGKLDESYRAAVATYYFDNIAVFADACIEVGMSCGVGVLVEYGEVLARSSRAFDIQGIEALLHEYAEIVHRIREGLSIAS
jgi:PAS domain S-box-containing protein